MPNNELQVFKVEIKSDDETVHLSTVQAPNLLTVLHGLFHSVALLENPNYLVITVQPDARL